MTVSCLTMEGEGGGGRNGEDREDNFGLVSSSFVGSGAPRRH